MKTLTTIVRTIIVTMMVVMAGLGGLAFDNGIITVSQRGQEHTKTVIVDGVVDSEKSWTEVLGYDVSINIDEATYIGR